MKKITLIIVLFALAQTACKKSNDSVLIPTSLNGTWRMISVKNNLSGLTITKPPLLQGNVDITFTSQSVTGGTLSGNTPSNYISSSEYSIGSNGALAIPVLSMTKVGETPWGNEFVDNIRSSEEYSFEKSGKLNIKTTTRILTFQKQ